MRLLLTLTVSLISAAAWGANIIYVGDSQSASEGTLLSQLAPSLSAHHRLMAGNAACGTTIDDHLRGGPAHCNYRGIQHMNVLRGQVQISPGKGHVVPIDTLFSSAPQSDTVVVELGDNHYGDRGLAAKATAMATKILNSGRSCVWIGPASIAGTSATCHASRQNKKLVADVLQRTLDSLTVKGRKCRFINSYELTKANPPRSTDSALCIHYPGNYGAWASAIRPSVLNALKGPSGIQPQRTSPARTRR